MSATASFEDCTAMKETDKALLIDIDGEEYWVPKSAIHDDSEVYDNDEHDTGKLVVHLWWAESKGLA